MGFLKWLFSSAQPGPPDEPEQMVRESTKPARTARASYAGFSRDDWSRVALDDVYSQGLETSDSFWRGTLAQCDAVLVRIAALRKEYSTREPRQLRRELLGWLDHYERQARKDRLDIETQAHRKEMDQYYKDTRQDRERASALRDELRKANLLRG